MIGRSLAIWWTSSKHEISANLSTTTSTPYTAFSRSISVLKDSMSSSSFTHTA